MNTRAEPDAEVAVRSFLRLLEDPNSLVDAVKVADLQAIVAAASDPIDKLRAVSELDRARVPDRDALESAFIGAAKTWATVNDIPVSSFRQLGVSDQTLQAAGLLASRKSGRRRGGRSDASRDPGTAVSKDTIKAYINTVSGEFVLAEIAERAGGSPMTLRKAIQELLAEGALERLGTSTTHHGRGRAPIVYAIRTSKKAKK